ncbi:unnamed protein product [Paramecium pentaurelia]|uniref:Transmembrane protein n=1 Tax=Paramecium pentaurelia TaxID=43138 RepID=A0A8S1TTW4_9CILI|nr:unnamed protein product [Paramecium pentaurelia]
MSQNFTTQPCQIFGFITTSSNGRGNNEFFLLKHCISSTMSQIFGFAPNQTTKSGNIYFQSSTWNLIQTELVSFPFNKITRQFGSSEYISENLIQVRFIVTYVNVVDLYIVLFNQTTGKLISFVLDQGFYIDSNQTITSFLVFLGSNGLVMIQSFQDYNILTPQIYTFEERKFQIKYNTKKQNRMIGFEIIQVKPSQFLVYYLVIIMLLEIKLIHNYIIFRIILPSLLIQPVFKIHQLKSQAIIHKIKQNSHYLFRIQIIATQIEIIIQLYLIIQIQQTQMFKKINIIQYQLYSTF